VDHPVYPRPGATGPRPRLLDHDGPWTEGAYLALRHDGRVEVVDGTLIIGPGAGTQRARVIERVREGVVAALPDRLRVLGPALLRLGPDCVLVPDLVITGRPEAAGNHILDAEEALLVVEVIGRDHGAADRTFKPLLYARSRIPYSLLIDHDVPCAVAHMIIGGRYHEYAYVEETGRLRIEEPFPLEFDLAALTTPGP
jgi:Putative restriction endonuclease